MFQNSLIIRELIIQYTVLNKSRACLFIPAREHHYAIIQKIIVMQII